MKTLKLFTFLTLLLSVLSCKETRTYNNNYMWFDCEANYATLSHPDSIYHYMKKSRDLGFDNVVVDMKSIMGEVLYDSQIAPYMGDWEGVERSRDYDMLGYFIEYGKDLDMRVFGSLNVFAGGHNFHGKYEFVALEAMEKAMQVIINIAKCQ